MENEKKKCVRIYKAQMQSKEKGIIFSEDNHFDADFEDYLIEI